MRLDMHFHTTGELTMLFQSIFESFHDFSKSKKDAPAELQIQAEY